ncbi:hypothetical protein PENARI_c014G10626 [Penicillium arizonense]|uniref:Uncharacterized protein n=1 Tax=Penicillium arizonense TaxID=1835702 RepID=A0A1F5LDT6_PENAI|nr:hypothetical protein PENARI_c014G10626 [Penicillium arizonense]OGE51089.1 hypothetical protein PENARI_c014G10626 [Penicillium arizonense]
MSTPGTFLHELMHMASGAEDEIFIDPTDQKSKKAYGAYDWSRVVAGSRISSSTSRSIPWKRTLRKHISHHSHHQAVLETGEDI